MKAWLTLHIQVLMFTLCRFFGSPLASLLNITAIGITLSLPTGMYLVLKNVQSLAERETSTAQISVFLSADTSKEDIAYVDKQLKQHAGINRVKFISRDQALEQLKETTGLADVIGGMVQNPLPNAYIVYPRVSDAKALGVLRDELKKWPKFEYVQLDSAWAHKLEAMLKFGLLAVLILAILLGLAVVAVAFNTIRLQILTQRDEIEVSKLIGATDTFIRRPFLYFGLFQGLLGGGAAWLIVTISLYFLNGSLAELTPLYASGFTLHQSSLEDSLILLLLSAGLGWLGAWLSVDQLLRKGSLY